VSPSRKPVKQIAIYTRVSEQGRRSDEELLSHDLQRSKVEHYLAAKELVASAEVFEDNDKSGGKMSRPAFDRAVAGVLEGTLGGIAVARLSRFGRNTRGVLDLIERIEAAGGTVICLDPPVDTSSAAQRFLLTVFAALNALEREQGVEQAALVAEKKLAENKALGGTAPIGYDFEVVGRDSNGKDVVGWLIPNEEAPVVRATLEAFADGASVGKVADMLNAAGVYTRPTKRNPDGSPWRTVTARKFLRRAEVYTGVRVYGEQRIEGAHEAIVEPGVWRRISKRFAPVEVGGKRTRVRGDGYALGQGLVRCGLCSSSLMRSTANGTRAMLRCDERGSGHPSITLSLATDHVADAAFRHFGAFNYTRSEGGNSEEREAAQALLDRALAELHEAEEYVGTRLPADSKQRIAVEAAQAARDALDLEDVAVLRTFAFDPEWGGAEDNAERFAVISPPDQRRLLRAMGVEKVVLLAGVKGSPAERLRIEFSDGTVWNQAGHEAEQEAPRIAQAEAEWALFAKEHPRKAAKAKKQAEEFIAATGTAS